MLEAVASCAKNVASSHENMKSRNSQRKRGLLRFKIKRIYSCCILGLLDTTTGRRAQAIQKIYLYCSVGGEIYAFDSFGRGRSSEHG